LKRKRYRFILHRRSDAIRRQQRRPHVKLFAGSHVQNGLMGGGDMTWIRTEVLDRIQELPGRVDFDDWIKDRGLVNLLSKKNSEPWPAAGFYKRTKRGRLCVLEVSPSVKGVNPGSLVGKA
jgi:hypothetical protein